MALPAVTQHMGGRAGTRARPNARAGAPTPPAHCVSVQDSVDRYPENRASRLEREREDELQRCVLGARHQ